MSGKIAIHQPNFLPWLPFFYKMEKCDTFILMINCQFEKNGYQNRANVFEKWWTFPVLNGTCEIKDKKYANGLKLIDVNIPFIIDYARLLNIDISKIHFDFPTDKRATDRIIEICKRFDCDQYLTNPEATVKYLDERLMNDNGIEIVSCQLPPEHRKHLFEAFNDYGLQGTIDILKKDYSPCKV